MSFETKGLDGIVEETGGSSHGFDLREISTKPEIGYRTMLHYVVKIATY